VRTCGCLAVDGVAAAVTSHRSPLVLRMRAVVDRIVDAPHDRSGPIHSLGVMIEHHVQQSPSIPRRMQRLTMVCNSQSGILLALTRRRRNHATELLVIGVTAVSTAAVPVLRQRAGFLIDRGLRKLLGLTTRGGFSPRRDVLQDAVVEFKTMVKACIAGIEVILDVVFNHTGRGEMRTSGVPVVWGRRQFGLLPPHAEDKRFL